MIHQQSDQMQAKASMTDRSIFIRADRPDRWHCLRIKARSLIGHGDHYPVPLVF